LVQSSHGIKPVALFLGRRSEHHIGTSLGNRARHAVQTVNLSRSTMKLIIPMAGRGTRVRPHSHVTPKPLLNVRGKSMVERIVDMFNQMMPRPMTEGVFVLAPDFGDDIKGQLTEICDRHGMEAHFAVQETPLGTAHAVRAAKEHLSGEGVIVYADTLFYMDPLSDFGDADCVAWVKHVEDPSRFGVAVRDGERIVEFVEKPAELISHEALIGIYYVKDLTRIATSIEYLFDNDLAGPGGEYFLTDAFDRMLKEGDLFTTAGVTDWLDCGTIPALMDTTQVVLERENSLDGGGTATNSVIIPPVYLGPGAQVVDSVVGPNVSLEAGARITNATVRSSIVFANAVVENSALSDSLVGQHASVTGFGGSLNIGDHSTIG
jgi:glucose-1-phosphate thymidylyltransferase